MLVKDLSTKIHVGIDVSKLTLDAFILERKLHRKFKNNSKGFTSLFQWVKKQSRTAPDTILFCFEHTGLYSLQLALFLEENGLFYSMIPPLEIKNSLGLTRGKNDMVDSMRIADFSLRYEDKLHISRLPTQKIRNLHSLLTLRDKLAKNMRGYIITYNESLRVMQPDDFPELFCGYRNTIAKLKEEIGNVERSLKAILKSDTRLWTTYKLVTGIKGIGLIVASYMIVYTHNFTRFDTWRKFACFSGIAPFDHESGTSVKGKTKVSPIANKRLKTMLHLSAICAIHTDTELKEYYHRRLAEGKPKMSVINIIRNKLVSRAFAVVKRGTPFVDIKRYMDV